jgi:hypothetical protein
LLILCLGPVVLNPVAIAVRSAAWRLAINGLTKLTAIFILWYLLRLPSFGAGDFSSFMNQCMLLGPIVGMGGGIAAAHAMHGRSKRWGALAVLSVLPLLASGSRVATLAASASVCFLFLRRKPFLGLALVVLCLLGAGSIIGSGDKEPTGHSPTAALTRKGIENSRTDMWKARISEFTSSPLIGIGIAMGTGSGSEKEADGAIRVEPGSSYLAVLAMTGGVGTVAFFSALGLLLFGFASTRQKSEVDRDILSVVGIFLAVNGVAEGWILGFGSPLCFLFWLWLGNVGDAALQPVGVRARRGQLNLRRFGPSKPALRAA